MTLPATRRLALIGIFSFLATSFGADEPKDGPPKYTNRLAKESSLYLRMHAHNPVDWYPWGEEAFAKARKENKVVFLSVGYSSCYWCHVMERESFMDEEIAKFLNENFVCIKVDREERPDVDEIYMQVAQMFGNGGWPMTVFMQPDAKTVLWWDLFSSSRWRPKRKSRVFVARDGNCRRMGEIRKGSEYHRQRNHSANPGKHVAGS